MHKTTNQIVATLPHEMQAVIAEHGELVQVARPVPKPASGEVLIRVAATALNRADILQRLGKYPPPAGTTDILGLECAGWVVAHGAGVKMGQWPLGMPVAALLSGGGYAEYCTVPVGCLLSVPTGWSLHQAATLPEALATLTHSVLELGALQRGDYFFIAGGSSGLGTYAIQLLRAWGAKVGVSCRSHEKAKFCKDLGADFTVVSDLVTNPESLLSGIQSWTDGKGVSLVLDMVAGGATANLQKILGQCGRYVCIATQAGRQATLDFAVMMLKKQHFTGTTLRSQAPDAKAALLQRAMTEFGPVLASGQVQPVVAATYPLLAAGAAHAALEGAATIGKIVLAVTDE